MRILDSTALTALDSGRFMARNGFAIDMPDGTFALWDDAYDATISGVSYSKGAGTFTISPIPSAGDLGTRSVDISMSGIDPGIAASVVSQPWHQRTVSIARFVIAVDAPTVIYAKTWFSGFLDTLELKERAGGTSDLVAHCEDINRELGRKNTRTRSPVDQKQLYSGDKFFDYCVAAVNTEIVWGRFRSQPVEQPRRRGFFGLF